MFVVQFCSSKQYDLLSHKSHVHSSGLYLLQNTQFVLRRLLYVQLVSKCHNDIKIGEMLFVLVQTP